MGRSPDDPQAPLQPVSNARRRAMRAVLSAVAGGGLTAAGLGPLAGAAFGTGADTTSTPETATTPVPTTTTPAPEAEAPPSAGNQPTTSTSTPSTTPSTPSTPSTATPPPAVTEPATTTSIPAPPPPKTPVVVLQHRQKNTAAAKSSPRVSATKPAPGAPGSGPNNVAASPQAVAQAGALAALLASSE